MKTLVILNGECKDLTYLKVLSESFDKIICADGGYLHAVASGIVPDIVVGDFDSSELPDDIECLVYPKDKDLSDAEIAIEYALENFGNDITLTCALGKRLDHQLFNIFILIKYPHVCIEEINEKIFMCNAQYEFCDFEGKTISFLPVGYANISLENFKYNLLNHDVKSGETVTLSNIALENAAITVNDGKVIAVVNKNNI